jgi:hypothetical protein
MDQAERCKTVWDPYWGAQKLCSKMLSFTMEPDDIAAAEQKIAKNLQNELRYDMKVALVALPDGGYNVVALNRRPRTDVHGMCDPSCVAFDVAFLTANSKWKSRLLQIWTKPYDEGWYLSTSGSRNAIRQGKARSVLGWLGVVNLPTFRKWLDKSFRPLPSIAVTAEPAHEPPAVVTYETVPPTTKGLPAHPDSGSPLAVPLTQPPQPSPTPAQTTEPTTVPIAQAAPKRDTQEHPVATSPTSLQPSPPSPGTQPSPSPTAGGTGTNVAVTSTEKPSQSKPIVADKEPLPSEPRPARKQRAVKEKKPTDPDENYLFKPAPKKEGWKDPFAQ